MSEHTPETNEHNEHNDPNPPSYDTTVIHSAPAPAQSNGNMIMVLVMIMILLIGAVVAFALKQDSTPDDQVKIDGKNDSVLASGNSNEEHITTIINSANTLRASYESMKTGYVQYKQRYEQQLSANSGNLQNITNLGNRINLLTQENNRLKALAGNASAYQAQVISLNKQIELKSKQLEEHLSRSSKGDSAALDKALAAKLELQAEVKKLKQKMMMMGDTSQIGEMKDKLTLLEQENGNLERRLQKLQASIDFSKLFVTKDKLPAKAQNLYDRLNKLETVNTSKLAAAYAKIGDELQAVNLQRVKFSSGSAALNFADQNSIRERLKNSENGDYFLVVGYASTTGDAKNNETLSAKRATAVAAMVNRLKQQGQDVRAVYLGQTKRFSQTNHLDNQLCEVWQIKQ